MHFRSYDALRFLAFLKVFLHHIPVHRGAWPAFEFLQRGGGLGVQFFFVLSGFLITYLLVAEKQRTGQLDLKRFYWKRVLRIFPLYYLVVAFCYGVLAPLADAPEHDYVADWRYSVLFLENYHMLLADKFPNIGPLGTLWSLCIEEHFYLFWPFAVAFIPLKRLPYLLLACLLLAPVFRVLEWHFSTNTFLLHADLLTNMDLLAAGSMLGYALVRQPTRVLHWADRVNTTQRWLLLGFIALVVLLGPVLFASPVRRLLEQSCFAVAFTGLLFLFLPQDSGFHFSDAGLFSRLGKISYGLYMYHVIALLTLRKLLASQGILPDSPLHILLLAIPALLLTVLLSVLSYRWFEAPILKLRG